ncbi:MAG TPA: hypothetical protein P5026_07600 [Kiritimatiellia bacterium]|nr:hypothetical protein [Kiritimatiellia bacterium]HRU70949.1 hypothetical protein [Kiritimatiellia bacterium]
MKRQLTIFLCGVACLAVQAATTNWVVQVDDAGNTLPPNTIATPSQVDTLEGVAGNIYTASANLAERTASYADRVRTYSTNYVVTSTVYVQSIGGVAYNPSNQTIIIRSISTDSSTIKIQATVKQTPLQVPVLDWRMQLTGGEWEKCTATVQEIPIQPEWTDTAKAYEFSLPKPSGDAGRSAFFRVVDNSSGASGSGLWWVVFGGICVDGKMGYSGTLDAGGGTVMVFKGGVLVEPTPLGGL